MTFVVCFGAFFQLQTVLGEACGESYCAEIRSTLVLPVQARAPNILPFNTHRLSSASSRNLIFIAKRTGFLQT
jgi:hypothetical protein